MEYGNSKLYGATDGLQNRVMIGIPMTGLLRAEWVIGRYGQIIPCNWSQTDAIRWLESHSPVNYLVADARNSVVSAAVTQDFEWLLFIDHDVILPYDFILKMNEYILKADIPVVSGLYFTKSIPSEPLIYRGRGNSYYDKWKMGDRVWVDGIPMGSTLIHMSILREMWKDAPEYTYKGEVIRRVYETPRRTYHDPETQSWFNAVGTEDLDWCKRVIDGKYLKKAGWADIAKKKYPFLIDTGIFCKHINPDGRQYPAMEEEKNFS
jgi:hypothetical protein